MNNAKLTDGQKRLVTLMRKHDLTLKNYPRYAKWDTVGNSKRSSHSVHAGTASSLLRLGIIGSITEDENVMCKEYKLTPTGRTIEL